MASVSSVAFSHDGKYLVSGSGDNNVIVWETASGRVLHKFPGEKTVSAVAIGPESDVVASAGDDQLVTLRDIATGRKLRVLSGHEGIVWTLSFSPDGKLVASGSGDGTIRLWEVATGRHVRTLSGHQGTVNGVVFLPGRGLLASGSVDGTVKIWDVSTGEIKREFSQDVRIRAIAVSAEGKLLAAGGGSSQTPATTVVWNLETGNIIHTRSEPKGIFWFVAFGPEGKRLATGGSEGKVVVEDLSTGNVISTIRQSAFSAAFSPDGELLATGNFRGLVQLWDPETGEEVRPLAPRIFGVNMTFCPEGKLLAASGAGVELARLWDLGTGRQVQDLWDIKGRVVFCPNGKYLAIFEIGEAASVSIWDREAGEKAGELSVETGEFIVGAAFTPDGKQLVTGGHKDGRWPPGPGIVRMWEVPGGDELRKLDQTDQSVAEMFFTPDGERMVTRAFGVTAHVWDVSEGRVLRDFLSPLRVHSISVSPDGSLLAMGLSAGEVKLWDLATGEELRTLSAHKEGVHVAFSSDGRVLATGCREGSVRLWDVAGGEMLRAFQLEEPPVSSIAFSADGRFMGISGAGLMHLYEAETAEHLLTILPLPAERDKYIAWTPEGYYMGSREGEIVLSVKVDEDYVPVEEYREALKRPEMVAGKLAGEQVPVPDLKPGQ